MTIDPATRVSGPAILGRPGHQLSAALTGAVSGKDSGTFTVSAGTPAITPLPGLALSDASGTVTLTRGTVRFDVRARTARPWTPVPGVSVAGAVELANMIRNDGLVPAPGITGTTPWLDVAGAISVPSGVTVPGEAVINLATGKGLLTGGGASAPRPRGQEPHRGIRPDRHPGRSPQDEPARRTYRRRAGRRHRTAVGGSLGSRDRSFRINEGGNPGGRHLFLHAVRSGL